MIGGLVRILHRSLGASRICNSHGGSTFTSSLKRHKFLYHFSSTTAVTEHVVDNGSLPVVTTYRQAQVPTFSEPCKVPLSITDIHLRQEQLPLCFFFRENLCEKSLEESLQEIVKIFPQTGGVISSTNTTISCHPDDSVSISYGTINRTLEEWQNKPRGHGHSSFSLEDPCDNGGHPILLPLFDSLFDPLRNKEDRQALTKIRITYFKGGGTAIGVNFSHALGDTATCVHFVQSWGRQMRKQPYKRATFDRRKACVSGMMTTDIAEIMDYTPTTTRSHKRSLFQRFVNDKYLPDFMRVETVVDKQNTDLASTANATKIEPLRSGSISHEYVRLHFPLVLLDCLKQMGSDSCKSDVSVDSFVSTNDMLTSFGWLLKRRLSMNEDYSLSMVYNMRGRAKVDPFLFGNGIGHVVASQPSTDLINFKDSTNIESSSSKDFVNILCSGAKCIRSALKVGLSTLPEALAASQLGTPLTSSSSSTQSFSTTNWGRFPLYEIQFANQKLSGFHAHPAHPLPSGGRIFASVILPCADGSIWYELLLPSDQAQQAKNLHDEMSSLCMKWMEDEDEKAIAFKQLRNT